MDSASVFSSRAGFVLSGCGVMTALRDFLPDPLRGRVKGGLEAGIPFKSALKFGWNPPFTCTGGPRGENRLESLWAGGRRQDSSPFTNFHLVRGAVRRGWAPGGGLGSGTSLFSRRWSNQSGRAGS